MGFHGKNMIDEDRFVALLKNAVNRVKTEEDPLVLNQYKKLFKKNVPFSLRMYVAAYFAKNASFRGGRKDYSREKFRSNGKRSFNLTENDSKSKLKQKIEIDDSVAATIFLSVGRNRRVFPRDLIHLIVSSTGVDRDHIGEIKILDSYSFVQLFADDAEKVILGLNGTNYRGRSLQVSYSRKKEDKETGDTIVEDTLAEVFTSELNDYENVSAE